MKIVLKLYFYKINKLFMKPTLKEYHNALETIKRYENPTKTPVKVWIALKKPSKRLANILIENFEFIEDVDKDSLLSCRNAGKKSFWELIQNSEV